MSNDNFHANKYQKPNLGGYYNKYEEEKRELANIPSYRKGMYKE